MHVGDKRPRFELELDRYIFFDRKNKWRQYTGLERMTYRFKMRFLFQKLRVGVSVFSDFFVSNESFIQAAWRKYYNYFSSKNDLSDQESRYFAIKNCIVMIFCSV